MSKPESWTPLPPVNADDLRRVWALVLSVRADSKPGTLVSIAAPVYKQQCSPGTDVNAVVFRAGLLQFMFQQGLLDDWRDGDELTDSVFQVCASLPMEKGVEGFNPADFIARLRRA
jgi:hypothetical protein